MSSFLDRVGAEMDRQVELWGPNQTHPTGTGSFDFNLRADGAKRANDAAVVRGTLTWAGILLEEVYEALAEKAGTDNLVTELIQVAAVAGSMVRDIESKTQRQEQAVAA